MPASARTYMCGLMAFGKPDDVKSVLQELHKRFLLKDTGGQNDGGTQARFLGGSRESSGATISIYQEKE